MANALDLIYGRRPSIRNGKLAGFRTTPGATQSPRDSMVNLTGGVGARPMTGGLSSGGTWDSFFKRTESLAPVAPTDAYDMASAMDESSFFAEEPTDADGYAKAALTSATKYFDGAGLERPAFGGGKSMARSGDSFSGPYGTGSVKSGMDYQEKLKRLTSVSLFDDPLFQ